MDVYRRGGDSLMDRYLLYRMHPFSVAETLHQDLPDPKQVTRAPQEIEAGDFAALWLHGGYPEPYYQEQLHAPFAFQVVLDATYVDADCFAKPRAPVVVPAKTFLSQLL